jgi:uncharacterized membrane protein YhaH (DUF805 family)
MNRMFTIEGRRGRLSYFGATLLLLVVQFGLAMLLYAVTQTLDSAYLVGLLMLYPSVCITAQRLHDIGISAWWYLLFFVPIANILFGIAILFWPGQRETNDYGPSLAAA